MTIHWTIALPPSLTTIPTTLQSSVTFDDPTYGAVVFNFSAAVPVGEFVNSITGAREFFVVSAAPFAITSITPVAAIIDGYAGNGVMQDAFIVDTGNSQTAPQGFDGWLGAGAGPLAATWTPYSDTVNLDPAINGAISVAAGAKTTFTKSVRLPGTTVADWQSIAKYVHLHVLPEAPLVGSYPPSASSLTKPMANRNSINWAVLQSLDFATQLPNFPLTVAQTLARTPRRVNRFILNGERARRYRVDKAINPDVGSNYVGDLCTAYTSLAFSLHRSGLTTQERQDLADRVICYGMDYFGFIERQGSNIVQGAGQGGSVTPYLYYTAFLLQDAALLAIAQATKTDNNGLLRWGDASQVGQATLPGTTSPTTTSQTFFDEDIGVPYNVAAEFTTDHAGRYVIVSEFAIYPELSAIWALRNGPSGISGARAFLAGAAENDLANDKTAGTAEQFRARKWNLAVINGRNLLNWQHEMFDVARPLTDLTGWTGVPDQPPYGGAAGFTDNWFTIGPGNGQVSYNASALDFTTLPILQLQTRYSLDGRQWMVQDQGLNLSGVISGMNPVSQYLGFRRRNAAGWSKWSANYALTSASALRSVRTPPGTASGTPINTVAPKLLIRKYPLWSTFPVYDESPSVLTANASLELAAGVGYWTGETITGWGFQWQISDDDATWADISGATSYNLTRTAAMVSKYLRYRITPANAGSPTVYSNSVRMPAAVTIPAGTIIDTTFDNAFAITYAASLAAAVGGGGTLTHQPTQTLASYHQGQWDKIKAHPYGAGVLKTIKTAGNPSITLPLPSPLIAGKTYRIQAELAQGFMNTASGAYDLTGTSNPGTFRFDLQNQVGGASLLAGGAIIHPAITLAQAPARLVIDTTVTIGGANINGQVFVRHDTSTGAGNNAADPIMTALTITEVA